MKAAFSLLTICGILLYSNVYAQVPAKTLPDFEFSRLDNSSFTKQDLARGGMTFFMFLDPDCEHCQRAIKNIDSQYRSFEKVAVYLISQNNGEKMKGFLNQYTKHLKSQKNVVLLIDTKNQFIVKFQPRRFPGMFLYSADNTLIDYEDNSESVFRLVHFISLDDSKKKKAKTRPEQASGFSPDAVCRNI
jgi:peroxiredoxin